MTVFARLIIIVRFNLDGQRPSQRVATLRPPGSPFGAHAEAPAPHAGGIFSLVKRGCATQKWRSSRRAARLPVVLKAVVEVAASQGDDGVGSPDRPEHARLFETRADYGLAAGFDDA